MSEVLYINACVRKESRTNRLAQFVLKQLSGTVEELSLKATPAEPLTEALLEEREEWIRRRDFSHPSFAFGRQFAAAHTIVIAAPYWDLSFPAVLKAYFERVNVAELVFRYREDGTIESLCQAKKLIYVTTAGGPVFEPNGGYAYTKQLAEVFWGNPELAYYKAEGLDLIGADVEKILERAEGRIHEKAIDCCGHAE